MAIDPFRQNYEVDTDDARMPSKTYRLDRRTGRVRRTIDGEDALRQMIWTTLETDRYRHLIYGAIYGSELRQLITDDLTPELLRTEIPRVIREALLVDDRSSAVTKFEMSSERDAYFIRFNVEATDGWRMDYEMEV